MRENGRERRPSGLRPPLQRDVGWVKDCLKIFVIYTKTQTGLNIRIIFFSNVAAQEIIRRSYLDRLAGLRDQRRIIKVICGFRYSGKSVILRQFRDELIRSGVSGSQIVFLDLDEMIGVVDNGKQLFEAVQDQAGESPCVLLDGVQSVEGWQDGVREVRDRLRADVYLTLPPFLVIPEGALDALGDAEVITVYPLSFREFLQRYPASDERGYVERFNEYLDLGGMPYCTIEMGRGNLRMMSDGVFNAILN